MCRKHYCKDNCVCNDGINLNGHHNRYLPVVWSAVMMVVVVSMLETMDGRECVSEL